MKNQTLYTETVPVFIHFLGTLQKILAKGQKHARKARGLNEKTLVGGKLAPDMYPLTQQVGYAYFMAFETVTNLTGKQPPEFTYDEKNIKELNRSLGRAVTFLKTIKPRDIKPDAKTVETFLLAKKKIPTETYVRMYALPNFFFHVTTAYDILRHLGVPLVKEDYLGSAR